MVNQAAPACSVAVAAETSAKHVEIDEVNTEGHVASFA
jgi:hypothetical protein